jgi:hypothetical protein
VASITVLPADSQVLFEHAGAQSYRGLAIMRVEDDSKLALHGDYFTDQGQSGTLTLSRSAARPIWTFWK